MSRHGILRYIGIAVIFLYLSSGHCSAAEDRRRIEEETRDALKPTESVKRESDLKPVIDYGGWVNFRYIDYHDDDKDAAASDLINYMTWFDTRFWAKAALTRPNKDKNKPPQEYAFYVRVKNLYSDSHPKETAGGSDNDGPHLDYAYLSIDAQPVWLKLGRQYFTLGQGVAYGDVDDGVSITYRLGRWDLKALWSHTLPHKDNIDTGIPGYDKTSDRQFFGLQTDYLGLRGQNIYGYALFQKDFSDSRPNDPDYDYTYDSQYVALGARGKIKNVFSYWWESIRQTGRSMVYETQHKSNISAWAHIMAFSYEPKVYSQPSIYFKYAYGSGDSDRLSVTDTINGNSSGKDRNFLYFGFLPTGYALAPMLSNLYFFKTGFSFKPLEKNKFFKGLSTAIDFYRYYKVESRGRIYDTNATQDSSDIGSEIDLTVNWQILSDLSCALQYGHFIPGDAYPDSTNNNEDYLSISTTITF